MLINRRKFLQLGSLATGTIMLPKFLKAFEGPFIIDQVEIKYWSFFN